MPIRQQKLSVRFYRTGEGACKGVKMARKKTNLHVGSDFEDFLREEGRLEKSTALAIKRVLAWEFQQAMTKADISRAEMARRMRTMYCVHPMSSWEAD